MRSNREERIKQRAYELWQTEGHGHGRHEDHWHRAEREIAAEEAGSSKTPRRAARSKQATPEKSAAVTPVRGRSTPAETRAQKSASPKKPAARGRKPAKES